MAENILQKQSIMIVTAEEFAMNELYEYYVDGKNNPDDRTFREVPINRVIEVMERYAEIKNKANNDE